VVPAKLELERGAVLVGGDALLVKVASRGLQQLAVEAVKRGTAPEPQRIAVARYGLTGLAGVPGGGRSRDQLSEPLVVEVLVADFDLVSVGMRDDGRGSVIRGE